MDAIVYLKTAYFFLLIDRIVSSSVNSFLSFISTLFVNPLVIIHPKFYHRMNARDPSMPKHRIYLLNFFSVFISFSDQQWNKYMRKFLTPKNCSKMSFSPFSNNFSTIFFIFGGNLEQHLVVYLYY